MDWEQVECIPEMGLLQPLEAALLPPPAAVPSQRILTLEGLSDCIINAHMTGGSEGSSNDAIKNAEDVAHAAEGGTEALLGANAASIGQALGNGELPGVLNAVPTKASYGRVGAQVQSGLREIAPYVKGAGVVTGAIAIGTEAVNGYKTGGAAGAAEGATYGTIDTTLETGAVVVGDLVGAGVAIGFDKIGGSRTLARGANIAAAAEICYAAAGIAIPYW